jgi:NADH-quinone oxidoreductase subunit L
VSAAIVVILAQAIAMVACLAVGHRSIPLVRVIAVGGASVSWVAALAAAGPHVGDQLASERSYATVATGALPIEIALRVDALSAVMLVLATSIALAVQIYSVAYMQDDPRYPSYASIVSLFTASMTLVVVADDLFVLLVGWEAMGICSYFLISHHWELPEARSGAVKAFLMTRTGDVGFLFGIFTLGSAAGSYRISDIEAAAASGDLDGRLVTIGALLLLCGVVGKSAQFPLHTWLPDAMPGPTPISALIHAATMVAAGVFLVARLYAVFSESQVAMTVLAIIASITMLGSALFALAQDDLKRLLAWSTVSQLAYMFGGLAVGGYTASIMHLLAHGAFKALLFLAAGVLAHAVGTTSLSAMGGLRQQLPVTFVTMTIGFAALAGVAPMAGFFTKDAILGAAFHDARDGGLSGMGSGWLILVCGLLTVIVTAAYSFRAWLLVFFGQPTAEAAEAHEQGWLMSGPLVVLAVLTAEGGVVVLAPVLLGETPRPVLVHAPIAILTTLLMLLSCALTYGEWWRLDGRDPAASLGRLRRPLAREFAVDEVYDVAVVRPVRQSATMTVGTDRDVVEPYVFGSGAAAVLLGRLVRLAQTGRVQTYLTVVVVGVVAIAASAGVMAS